MIRTGVPGKITKGDEAGRLVFIEELPDNPPSYLILISPDEDLELPGGDYWVEDYSSLVEFFKEGAWIVEWMQ